MKGPPTHARAIARLFELPRAPRAPRIRRRVRVLPGRVTLITGDSGSGKSTLLRTAARGLARSGWTLIDLADIPLDSHAAVIDAFADLPLETAMAFLSRAGLAEAAAMLRLPSQLSVGQRFRFRLARALALASRAPAPAAIVADEFAATLDRLTARVISFGLRKQLAGTLTAALVATSHDDLAVDLSPIAAIRL